MTENYAIFFIYPIHIDMTCAVTHLLHNMLEVGRDRKKEELEEGLRSRKGGGRWKEYE